MRWLSLWVSLGTFALTACAHRDLPPVPPPTPPESVLAFEPVAKPVHPGLPKVVARILREEKELVDRSRNMAHSLPDPRGRARAEEQALDLARELEAIEGPIDDADSDKLDELVDKLVHLEGRIELLYFDLHAATDKESPVASGPDT